MRDDEIPPAPVIPPRTREEIQNPAPRGQRHEQMLGVALDLLEAGLKEKAVFVQLRETYEADVTDHEIDEVIKWAASKNQKSSKSTGNRDTKEIQREIRPKRVTPEQAIANTEKWLGDFRCDQYDLWERSPWRPLEDWSLDALPLLAGLYGKADFINVTTDFKLEQKDDDKQKANPRGAGTTLLRDDWMRSIRDDGVPQSKAGAWIRPNPVNELGSGENGAVCDVDVTSYRFCFLESDDLPLELQLSLWARLPLPVAAIIDSAGRSVHARVRLDCDTTEEYRSLVERVYSRLAQFGICRSNKNPSRLSRLPGAQRTIGKRETSSSALSAAALDLERAEDGRQRLLYLNPDPTEAPIFERGK